MIRLWNQDDEEIYIEDYGLRGLRLIVPSPSYDVTRERIPGRSGDIQLGKDLLPRDLTAEFMTTAENYDNSLVLRDELYELFSHPFYIGEERQPGKRWYVECANGWTPERLNHVTSTFSIPLTAEKGLAESVGTTLEGGMLLQVKTNYGDPSIHYSFDTNTFQVWNDSDVDIDPRQHDLIIKLTGASSGLSITNHTTGVTWSYSGDTSEIDTITLDGVRSLKNSLSVFRDTNKKIIPLKKGWNEFEITGATDFTISFDFRFLYK